MTEEINTNDLHKKHFGDIKMKFTLFTLFFSVGLIFCEYAHSATVVPGEFQEMPNEDADYYYDNSETIQPMKFEMKYGKKKTSESDENNKTEENTGETENDGTATENEGVSLKSSSSEKSISYTCVQDSNDLTFCTDMNGKPLNGKIAEKISSTEYLKIENYKKGYRDGLCTYYNENGVLKERTYYKSGVKNGMSKLYYSHNNIQALANYKNGLLDGIVDIYTAQGKLLGRLRYKKGVLEKGTCYPNGKKENIKRDIIKNIEPNQIYGCGASS